MIVWFIYSIPVIAVLIMWFLKNNKAIKVVQGIASFLIALLSIYTVFEMQSSNTVISSGADGILYLDSLGAYFLLIISVIQFFVSIYTIPYIDHKLKNYSDKNKLKFFYMLLNGFILTMLISVSTQNFGVLWISIEASTLVTAFLVGLYNNKGSIEAAWKYIIICSVGIAFALLGIVILYFSSLESMGHAKEGLNWLYLFDNAGRLDKTLVKLSFIFIIAGFGTKAGLAPMHTWLPDAYSEAPSPISALFSGGLLNCLIYAILRMTSITNKTLGGSEYTGRLMIVLGVISVATAALFIVVQKDYKRLLAYSSIEHAGLIIVGIGIMTPLSIFAALFHALNHSIVKAMLFMTCGNMYIRYGTRKISRIKGLIKTIPLTGWAFLLGILIITGLPPFSLFSSKLMLVISAVKSGKTLVAVVVSVFLVLVFAGFLKQLTPMLYGEPDPKDLSTEKINRLSGVVFVSMLICLAVFGLWLPEPLVRLINSATEIVSGGN